MNYINVPSFCLLLGAMRGGSWCSLQDSGVARLNPAGIRPEMHSTSKVKLYIREACLTNFPFILFFQLEVMV